MKAMVAEHYGDGDITTDRVLRARMMNKQLPPEEDWFVWIGYYERKKWISHWASTPFLVLPEFERGRREDKRATHYNGHISTQIVGKLFIHIMRFPDTAFLADWNFALPDRGLLCRIWPPGSYGIAWPTPVMSDRDADRASEAMKRRIEGAAARLHAKDLADLSKK